LTSRLIDQVTLVFTARLSGTGFFHEAILPLDATWCKPRIKGTFQPSGIAMNQFTHFDDSGSARMVDVGDKQVTARYARASAVVCMASETCAMIREGGHSKGDVLQVARIAGITAAKRTGDLIPLCHPLGLDAVSVDFEFRGSQMLHIFAEVKTTGKTGVEMEALVAASVSALTVYDMCKSVDRRMCINQVQLEEKSGGRSGHYVRQTEATGK
jgi:cyclic pyranopterin phosphate synthase